MNNSTSRSISPWSAALLLAGSGWCALVYQTVWFREFRLIFGASTASTAAVLAVFMAGIGVGSAILGKKAGNVSKPMRLYAVLEIGIALLAAASPFLIGWISQLYFFLSAAWQPNWLLGNGIRLLLAGLVMGVPAFLMGGTLPAAVRAVANAQDIGRRRLSLLYGINTLGAVAGVAAANFIMLEALGNRQTLWVAAFFNLVVALLAFGLSVWAAEAANRGKDSLSVIEPIPQIQPGPPSICIYIGAFFTGFLFFLMELVWYRLLSPILGGSTFTFGVILIVALLGIGLGGLIYAWFGGNKQATLQKFALCCGLQAVVLVTPFFLGDKIALLASALQGLELFGFGGRVASWGIVTFVVVLPTALIAGFQFPLLISLLGAGSRSVAEQTGWAYAWNTAGALAGSLAGGFGLLPLLSAGGVWRLAVVMTSSMTIAALLLDRRPEASGNRPRWAKIAVALLALAAIGACWAEGPTAFWRHSGIGAGRLRLIGSSANQLEATLRRHKSATIWQADGVESGVALVVQNDLAFFVNGKSDGSGYGDRGTQIMAGLLAAMLHGNVRSVAVIGLGTGSTSGWLSEVPSIERVLTVEIEPVLAEVAKRMSKINRDVLNNSKHELQFKDGREALMASPESFDLIFSEPSNPYRAGIASLFTLEFYEACKKRLNEGGMFAQWLQAYEVDAGTVRTVIRTLGAVFPHVNTYQTTAGDLLLIGTSRPQILDVEALDRLAGSEPFLSAMRFAWVDEGVEAILARFVVSEEFTKMLTNEKTDPLNTDDRTILEFGFARSMGKGGLFNVDELYQLAREKSWNRPVVNGEVDWELVDRHSTAVYAERLSRLPQNLLSKELTSGINQQIDYYRRQNYEAFLKAAKEEKWKPSTQLDQLMLTHAMVEMKDEQAMDRIAELEKSYPNEALFFKAVRLAKEDNPDGAAQELCVLFNTIQNSVYIWHPILSHAFSLAAELGPKLKDNEVRSALLRSLANPFALYALDAGRWKTALNVATEINDNRRNAVVIAIMAQKEPWADWSEEYLEARAQIYADTSHPFADLAAEDLKRFRSNAPIRLVEPQQKPPEPNP